MRNMRLVICVFLAALFGLISIPLLSSTITYQARVLDSSGNDIDGPVTAGFRMYETLSASTVLWGETQNLTANKGIISVNLGAVNPLPPGLFNNPGPCLGITVSGDPEMTPRSRLTSTWKAMSTNKASGKSVQAGGATLSVTNESFGLVSITFPEAFQAPPVVMVGALNDSIGGIDFIPTLVTNVSTTGSTIRFRAIDGNAATGSADFDWIAIGN